MFYNKRNWYCVMINSVKSLNNWSSSANYTDNSVHEKSVNKNKTSFGHSEEKYKPHPVRDLFLNLTSGTIGLIGFNTVLWWLQDFVNGKILVGKINKHFTDKVKDTELLKNLAGNMVIEHGLDKAPKKLHFFEGLENDAFYTHTGSNSILPNSVVVGKKQVSSLFHEIGHAVEENNKPFFKWLQRGRGHYSILALGLYALLSQNKSSQKNYYDNKPSGITETLLSKSNTIIPILAFSPELITEAKASLIGLKSLKNQIGNSSQLYKNISRSYLTCFMTYLFIPVSIILMDSLQRSAQKRMYQNKYY